MAQKVQRKRSVSKHRKPRNAKHRKRASHSTAIVHVAAPAERPWELSQPQVVLLKNYLHLQDASDVELTGCLEVARRYRIDPFKKGQIWFVRRYDSNAINAAGGKGAYVYTPQLGIYGMAHIAARDHSDYGTFTKPEYGASEDFQIESHKIRAPQWCRVGLTKKGVSEPSIGEAFFEEFCPKTWKNAEHFWAVMPHRMIAKCAKAQALREAYPDLGGLYIPEEMERFRDNYTDSGRQITYQEPQKQPSVAQEDIESLRSRGLWCPEHNRLRSANHLKTCESSRKAIEGMKKPPSKPVQPKTEAPKGKEPSEPQAPAPASQDSGKPQLTLDWQVSEESPRLTGDADLIEKLKPDIHASWVNEGDAGSFWHVQARDGETLRSLALRYEYKLIEILPKQDSSSAPTGARGTTPSPGGDKHGKRSGSSGVRAPDQPAPAVEWMEGTVEQANPGTGKNPRLNILFRVEPKKSFWLGCFDKTLFPFLSKAAGMKCQFVVEKRVSGNNTYTNVIGIKRIGNTYFDDDGKTPCIQQADREPGKTLFP